MKTWRVYRSKYGNIEVVKDGFNFCAFFFPGFWGFMKSLYAAGFVGIFGVLAINRLPDDQIIISIPLIIGLMTIYGMKGNSWVISSLTHNGYEPVATVKAPNKKAARLEAKTIDERAA